MNWNGALVGLFLIHLLVFSILWYKRRDSKYIGPIITFILLVTTYTLKIVAPDSDIGSLHIFEITRILAWCSLAMAVIYRIFLYTPKVQNT